MFQTNGFYRCTFQFSRSIFKLFAVSLFCLLLPGLAEATVHVEWQYNDQSASLAGFRLYLDGTKICETADPNARQMDCAYAPPTGQLTFTMTAFDTNNNESNFSSPYTVNNSSQQNPPANNAPNANPGSFSTTEDLPVSSALSATDQDGDTLTYSLVNGNCSKGSISLNANGTFTYTPNANANGTDSFTFKVNDGTVDSNPATVTITITPANDAPVAANDSASTRQGRAVSIQALSNDNDVDNDTLNLGAVTNGSHGTTAIKGTAIVYTPAASFSGTDSFTYTVSDGHGGTDTASITVSVTPVAVNDTTPPSVIAPTDITMDATGLLTKVNLGRATAVDAVNGSVAALASDSGPLTPGRHVITWTARDAAGNTGTATQIVNIRPLADFGLNQQAAEGGQVTVTVYLNGNAPSYPVTIPYTVSGTAVNPDDHDAADGTITITSGRKGSVTFNVVDDGISEDDETVIFSMGVPTNAARGTHTSHTVTITESNIAPKANLTAKQGNKPTLTAVAGNGPVNVYACTCDPNPADTHTFDWNGSDSDILSLASTSLTTINGKTVSVLSFDPAGLLPGIYTITVSVTDDGVPAKTSVAELMLRIIDTAPVLSALNDTDQDGTDDLTEGYDDADADGIPNYLDPVTDNTLLPTRQNRRTDWLLATEPGLTMRLGAVALSTGKTIGVVSEQEIAAYEREGGNVTVDNDNTLVDLNNIFDFEITGLPKTGQSAKVVLPLSEAIPANAVYRKCTSSAGWFNFTEDGYNAVASAPGEAGICPPPGDSSYADGLHAGDYCVQLTIQDGGPNDADGKANGIIQDPSGVGILGGGGSSGGSIGNGSSLLGGGGGGGGCALNRNGRNADPTLTILVLLSILSLLRKNHSRRDS